jgi:hypothetical protein
MADFMDSDGASLHILGLTGISQRARTIFRTEEGVLTPRDLGILSNEDLRGAITSINKSYRNAAAARRCFIGTAQAKKIALLKSWINDAFIEGNFTMLDDPISLLVLNNIWLSSLENIYGNTIAVGTDTFDSSKIIKYDGTNWFDSRKSLIDQLKAKKGAKGVSLAYIARLHDNSNWNDVFETMEERRIACYRHFGPGYDEDNRSLYNILVQFFAGTSCEDVIRRYERSGNGKLAWRDARDHLEGQDYKLQIVREANNMLNKASFSGNARLGFEDYYRTHVRAHLMLSEGGQPKSELEKITTFMSNITDQGVLSDYKNNRNAQNLRDNFQALYNHLAEGHRFDHPDGIPARVTRGSKKRTINQLSNGGRGYRGGRGRFGGRGRGRGRGRGYGRGGRGRGRGFQGRGNDNTDPNNAILPSHIVSNPHQEFDGQTWYAFSPQQKHSINILRQTVPRVIANMERADDGATNANNDSTSGRDGRQGNSSTAGSAMSSRPGRNN